VDLAGIVDDQDARVRAFFARHHAALCSWAVVAAAPSAMDV
jgi:hypothetical protein